jgi:hypothetical protein
MENNEQTQRVRRYLLRLRLFEIEKKLKSLPQMHPQLSSSSPLKSKFSRLYEGLQVIPSDAEEEKGN